MIENLEFWAIFVTVLIGFGATIKQNIDIRDSIREEEKRREDADRKIHEEFDKCRLHSKCPAEADV